MKKTKAEKLPNMTAIASTDVSEKGALDRKLKPTENDFRGRPGYERYHLQGKREVPGEAKDGSYKWRWKPGRGDAVMEAMMPWAREDVARVAKANGSPGDYGGGFRGKVMLLGGVHGDFCQGCDRLVCWCDCLGREDVVDARGQGHGRPQGIAGPSGCNR